MASDDRLWFTRAESAALCGLSARQFDEAIRPLAKSGERKNSKGLRFHGPAVVAALLEYRKPKAADDPDPLLNGSDSPALEQYRRARARMAELDLDERNKQTIRMPKLMSALRGAVAAFRATGDRLVREFGNGAGEIFNEGVDEFESAALRVIDSDADGRDNPDPQPDGVDADAEAADDR